MNLDHAIEQTVILLAQDGHKLQARTMLILDEHLQRLIRERERLLTGERRDVPEALPEVVTATLPMPYPSFKLVGSIRPTSRFPAWAKWLCRNASGQWVVTKQKPSLLAGDWAAQGEVQFIDPPRDIPGGATHPPVSHWHHSLTAIDQGAIAKWAGWIGQDADGSVRAFALNPQAGERWWYVPEGANSMLLANFEPNPDWRDTLRPIDR